MAKPNQPIKAYRTSSVWATLPSTIGWLRQNRAAAQKNDSIFQTLRCGINSTIILLSATCVEGFLVECLQSFSNRFDSGNTFEGRLNSDYYARVSSARGYRDVCSFFDIAIGKPLNEFEKLKRFQESVGVLFSFRNGLAHGRPFEWSSYSEPESNSWELEEWRREYKTVEKYLRHNNLFFANKAGKTEDFLTNQIANHFAELVEPYIHCVAETLPTEQSRKLRSSLMLAFTIKP